MSVYHLCCIAVLDDNASPPSFHYYGKFILQSLWARETCSWVGKLEL